jgi:hypothetical protein
LADAEAFVLALVVKSKSANNDVLCPQSAATIGGGGVEPIVSTTFSAPHGTNDVSTGPDGTFRGVMLVVATTGTAPTGAGETIFAGMLRTALEITMPFLPALTLLGTGVQIR